MNDAEQRIKELEAEVERLRSQGRSTEYTVREDTYKGRPVLVFAPPNAKPFTLGAAKLRAIQKCWSSVETFLLNHRASAQSAAGSESDRI
jgi:hypothetical protein